MLRFYLWISRSLNQRANNKEDEDPENFVRLDRLRQRMIGNT